MKTSFLCAALLSALLVSAPAAEPNADDKEVIEAVRSMFDAFATDDVAKFHEVAAADFYAFDAGKRFEGDELMDLVKKGHAGGMAIVWTITEPRVRVQGDIAWITYVNRGSIKNAAGTKEMTWLESAVLRKNEGKWRVQFLHSTRVPPAEG